MAWLLIYDQATGALREVTESDPSSIDLTGAGDPVAIDAPPDWSAVRWNPDTRALEPAIDEMRDARWNEAKAERDEVMSGGCSTPSGPVDTDTDSLVRIALFAGEALAKKVAGKAFSVDWTMADNSVVTLDANAMLAVQSAVVGFLNGCQQTGTTIRQDLGQATNPAAIAAVNLDAGYPA